MTAGSQGSTGVHVLVITALPDELAGIKAVDDGAVGGWEERQDSAGFPYHVREFTHARGGIMRVAVARPVDMSAVPASNVATRLVNELKPVCLAMSGICAGRRGEVSLGDVIVASRLFDAESGKLKATTNADGERVEEMLHEITTYNLDARWQHRAQDWPRAWCERWQAERPRTVAYQENWLLDALRRYEQGRGERPEAHPERKTQCSSWKDIILRLERRGLLAKTRLALTQKGRAHVDRQWLLHDGRVPDEEPLRVHVAPMATVSNVKQDPALFGRLLQLHRKVLAVDMESVAIGLVAALEQVRYMLVVKAVQDHADHDKDDSLRHFGTRVAAAFMLDFLRANLPAAAFAPQLVMMQGRQRSGQAELPSGPDIIDFTGERGRHERFFGRQDILSEFDEWLRSRDSGWLLLTGSPGLGKSAIFNQWLRLREQAGLPVAFHFIRRGIHNWADPAIIRASLAAQIERDFPEQRDANAAAALRLEQLLYRVGPVLEQRRQELVLLIDGLDEAMALGDGDNPIPRIFPHELPKRVFVFAASRPLYPHLDWFKRRTGALNPVDLDGRPGNLDTVHEFWTALRGTLSPPPTDDLVRAAVARSEGNVLHAVKLHQLWSQAGAERSINAIPHGFEGMLRELWERIGKLPRDQRRSARQGLSLLCAARQALPLSVIDELLDWDEGEARDQLLQLLRELLHEEHWHEQPAYRPFHEGVRELVARELPETLREHHRRLARFAAWPSTGSGFRHDYALRHRVVHQIEAGDIEEAAASCRDVAYLTEKAGALGVVEVEREIRLAARAQEPAARKHLDTLALAIGACVYWAREAPKALPVLLHDRLLSYAPAVHRELVWPVLFRQSGPMLRHPLQTGSLARVLEGHRDSVKSVAGLPNGHVVSGSRDNTLRVWNTDSGQVLTTLTGHEGWVQAVAVFPDGRVVSGSHDGTLRVWDPVSGQPLAKLIGHEDWVQAVAVLPDGRVVSGSADKTLRVWDLKTGKVCTALTGHEGWVLAMAVLPDGRIVSGSADKTLRVWDLKTGKVCATLTGHEGWVLAVAVLPDGRIISGSSDNTLRIWDVESGQASAPLVGHRSWVTAVAVLPDGRIISGSSDNTLRAWQVESGQVGIPFTGHQRRIEAVAVLADGRVVSGSSDNTLRIWDVESGPRLATPTIHQGAVGAVAVLADGRIVSGSDDKTLRIWEQESGQVLATLVGHEDSVRSLVVLPNGCVVSGSRDNSLRVWDIERGQVLAMLEGHRDCVTAIAVLPDGHIVSGAGDRTLRVWSVDVWQIRRTHQEWIRGGIPRRVKSSLLSLCGHLEWVTSVAAFPDGRVVSGSRDCCLRVWDAGSGQIMATLVGHQGEVMAVGVFPDGRVVSGSNDGTLRVWDVEKGQVLATLAGHQGGVMAVAVFPDGRVISGSDDRTLRVWDVENAQNLATVYGEASFDSVAIVSQDLIVAGDALGNVWFVDLP